MNLHEKGLTEEVNKGFKVALADQKKVKSVLSDADDEGTTRTQTWSRLTVAFMLHLGQTRSNVDESRYTSETTRTSESAGSLLQGEGDERITSGEEVMTPGAM